MPSATFILKACNARRLAGLAGGAVGLALGLLVFLAPAALPLAEAAPPVPSVWQPVGLTGEQILAMGFRPDGGIIYAGGDHGAWRSLDGGQSWHQIYPVRRDQILKNVTAFAVTASQPDLVWMAAITWVDKSEDAGVSWAAAPGYPGLFGTIPSVLIDANDPETVYFAHDGQSSIPGDHSAAMVSRDGGQTWKYHDLTLKQELGGMAISGENPTYAYVSGASGLFRSLDSGETWDRAPLAGAPQPANRRQGFTPTFGVAADPGEHSLLYLLVGVTADLGRVTGLGVWRSDDAGDTVVEVSEGLLAEWPGAGVGTGTRAKLAMNPLDPRQLFVSTIPGAVYGTANGGRHWDLLGVIGSDLQVTGLYVSPGHPQFLYASTTNGVWRLRIENDWVLPNGHFYTQASGQPPQSGLGYAVTNDSGIAFWDEFQNLGGVPTLGYPVSQRFTYKGFATQAFQKAVMQWQPGRGLFFLNVFDELHEAAKDNLLLVTRATPRQLDPTFDAGKSHEQIAQDRLTLLDANSAIRDRYFSASDPLASYGLPTSRVEDMGSLFAIRLQRAVIQQWKLDVPWARAGEVTIANGGDIAKEEGLFPAAAITPEAPP